ncbi:MAG TPA: NnrS family protein [Rhodocyclaceae bacterium]|nr:NnrS family protein [Rhodocyclaceae bacterium]
MRILEHPLWLVGFRPFFALACLAGMALPVLWAFIFAGLAPAPAGPFSPSQWHAHEMFFGFGWAVLGGFLLTSTKNWVQIRGYHGAGLAFLAAAWLFERVGMAFGGDWPPLLFRLSNNLFLGSIVAMLLATLIRHRQNDSYRDNYFFLVVLPAFLVSKNLMLSPEHFQTGWTMALGLFRMAFLVMLERTLTPFMKGAFQVTLLRNPRLDMAIKALGLPLVFADLLPVPLSAGIALLLAVLLAVRFALWHPRKAASRIDIGIMYLGYLGIVAQLLVEAADRLFHPAWVGTLTVHVFTFGTMGLIIPAMLVRISRGHTGRKVVFEAADKAALYIMVAAFALRVLAPQVAPGAYLAWIGLSAACWCAAFAILAWRYIPVLARPRVDGKEH